MTKPQTRQLDDGQPLVEFAPLKPAEFIKGLNPLGVVLQSNVGIAVRQQREAE